MNLTSEEWRFTQDRERLQFEREVAEAQLTRALEAYRESQASLARVLDTLNVLRMDQDARTKQFSDAVEELFNSTRRERP